MNLFILFGMLFLMNNIKKSTQQESCYLGCFADYKDGINRDVKGYAENSWTLTPTWCINLCKSKNFRYAALQDGGGCHCGNTYGSLGKDTTCNKPCTGDSTQMCGGWGTNSIYQIDCSTSATAAVSVGCYIATSACSWNDVFVEPGMTAAQCANAIVGFTDISCWTNNKCISQMTYSKTQMTADICVRICTTSGFKFGAVDTWSDKNFCACGNTIKYPTQTSNTCTVPCIGNKSQFCGSSNGQYYSVYSGGLPCQTSAPCQNNGACTNDNMGGYKCTCLAGFSGTNCQTALPCETSAPCQNNGVCTNDNLGGYKCTCLAGFSGTNCQTISSACTLNPNVCQNGGTCTSDNKGGYTCKCVSGFSGTNCQTALPCQTSKPCQNNGACTNDNMGGYKCTCLTGFTGTNCQTAVALPCTLNPNQCQNGGTCTNNNSGGYTCICLKGYMGINCQTLLPCNLANKCQNGGKCNNDFKGGYLCVCLSGFTGVDCQLTQTIITTTTTKPTTKAPYVSTYFENVGCYKASQSCNWNDVFVELGISLTQCAAAASARSMVCYVSTCSYSQINSSKSMTVDTCLQICAANSFKYAGLQSWSGKNFCGCGNTLKYPVDTPGACTSPCNGNTAQYCGDSTGKNWSVYNVKASFSSSTTPMPK